MAQPTRDSGRTDIDTDAGACRIEMPDGTLRVEEADGRVNIYAGPRNQRRRIRGETADGIEVHFYGGPAPARRYRMERKDNGTVEYFLPSETHRVNGRRFYAKWPNGRVDVFGGPDYRRSCVYSIHPDGRRDHYTGEAGKEVRTRIDCPVRGTVQILGTNGDREYIKETRWPRVGKRRIYVWRSDGPDCSEGEQLAGYHEIALPVSEPEWVAGSGASKVAALRKEYEQAWKPYLKLDAVQGALAMTLAPSEPKKPDAKDAMPYKVCTSTNPSESSTETSPVQCQHVVNELFRWLECTDTNQPNVAKEHQHHFTYQRVKVTVQAADGLEVRDRSWDVDCLSFPVTSPDKSYDLEDMFAHAMDPFEFTCSKNQYATREALKTLPETLLVKLDRQVPTGRAAPHPVVDPVLCDAPITFPDVIDFGDDANGFSAPLYESCARDRYRLVGILMGRGDAGSERWAYGFCHVKNRWGRVSLDVWNKKVFMNMHLDDDEVRRFMLGETEQTGGYVLKLYYQREPSLSSKLRAAIETVDSNQRFDTLAAVMGVSPKECARLMQEAPKRVPKVLTGHVVFELRCLNAVPKVAGLLHLIDTHEAMRVLTKTIRNQWDSGMDAKTRGRWIANAARLNKKHAEALSSFRTMSPLEVFSEQWVLTMMCGEEDADNAEASLLVPFSTCCRENTLWLRTQGYFEQLWEVLHPEYRNWFVRMAKERNGGTCISQEQGMMELWDNYKFALCAFLIPGSVAWREAGTALLRKKDRTSRAKLWKHFFGVLPEWKKQCDLTNDMAHMLRNRGLQRRLAEAGEPRDSVGSPAAPVKRDADGGSAERGVVTKEVDVAWSPTDTVDAPCTFTFSKDRPETLSFKMKCAMCNAPLGFTAPSTPGAEERVQCYACKGLLTVTIPDTRVMEAEAALCCHVQMFRARQELKRLRARRDLSLKVIKNISEAGRILRRRALLNGFSRSWRSFLPVLEELEKDPAFDPGKLNPTMVHLAIDRWLNGKTSLEAAVATIESCVLVVRARKKLHRLRKAAQARADAEARAAQRAAEEEAQRAARAARDAELSEKWRQERERAAAARAAAAERQAATVAAFEAREAERLEANRAAHADFLRRQEEARAARQQAAQAEAEAAAPAVAAARQARKKERAAARAAARASKKWNDPFKAEEARRAAHSKAEKDRKEEAANAAKAAEAAAEARRQAAREAAQIAQAEAAARTAEAEARAAARAAVRDAQREHQRSCERVDATSETICELVCDTATDREAERLIKEAVDAFAVAAASPKAKAVASAPVGHVHGWAEAAKTAQQTMREVVDADVAAREAEDLDMAIAASLETAGIASPGGSSSSSAAPSSAAPSSAAPSSAAAPAPSPPPPQFKNPPSRKQLRRLNQKHCWYFARGKCRYGDECQFLHAATPTAPEAAPEPALEAEAAPAPEPEAAPAPAPDTADTGANTKCIICFEGDKDVVCLPCRHQCACSGCLDVVRRFGTCPMCRQPIAEAFSVFIA